MDNNSPPVSADKRKTTSASIEVGDFRQKPRILVVDDDIHIVQMLRSNLEAEGYHVLCATDGLTGKSLAWEHQPDLIISDVVMPGVDGLSMVEAIFQRQGVKKMPVIFVSAQVTENFHPEEKGLPVSFALIKKPLFLPEFNLLVRQFLSADPSLDAWFSIRSNPDPA